MNFETIAGLEVHVELKTETKIMSPAPAHFGADPNMNIHVIDLAIRVFFRYLMNVLSNLE